MLWKKKAKSQCNKNWLRNNSLSSLNFKNSTIQDFGALLNNWSDCWANNPDLTTVCSDTNEIAILQNYLVSCGNTQNITITDNCALQNDSFDLSQIAVTPNPSSGIFNLDLSTIAKSYKSIEIYDLLGKTIFYKDINDLKTLEIDLSQNEKGFYFAKLFNDNNSVSIKLIKN